MRPAHSGQGKKTSPARLQKAKKQKEYLKKGGLYYGKWKQGDGRDGIRHGGQEAAYGESISIMLYDLFNYGFMEGYKQSEAELKAKPFFR